LKRSSRPRKNLLLKSSESRRDNSVDVTFCLLNNDYVTINFRCSNATFCCYRKIL